MQCVVTLQPRIHRTNLHLHTHTHKILFNLKKSLPTLDEKHSQWPRGGSSQSVRAGSWGPSAGSRCWARSAATSPFTSLNVIPVHGFSSRQCGNDYPGHVFSCDLPWALVPRIQFLLYICTKMAQGYLNTPMCKLNLSSFLTPGPLPECLSGDGSLIYLIVQAKTQESLWMHPVLCCAVLSCSVVSDSLRPRGL